MPRPFEKNKGFTLLELLIVIAIIAILVAIGLASFSTIQQRARDTGRQSDLKNLQGALEQFYNDFNRYPTATGGIDDGKIKDTKCVDASNTADATLEWGKDPLKCTPPFASSAVTYLRQLPKDPTGNRNFVYQICESSNQIYAIYAQLERDPGTTPEEPVDCEIPSIADPKYNFAVTPQ